MFLPSFTKFYEENRAARIEKGLRHKPRVRFSTQMLPALAFEKEEEKGISYDKILEDIQIVCDHTIKESEKTAKVDELCLYFGKIMNTYKVLIFLFPPPNPLW